MSRRPGYVSVIGASAAGQPCGASEQGMDKGAVHRGQSVAPAAAKPRYALQEGQRILLKLMPHEKVVSYDALCFASR